MAVQTPDSGCSRHGGLEFVFVCKTCDNELICLDCVLDFHNKHDLVKLMEHASDQKHKMQQYTEKLSKSDIPKLESEILENGKSWTKTSKELMEMNNDITRHGDQMKKEIDKISDRLVALCKNLEQMNRETKEKNKSVLTDFLRGKLRQQDRCQQALTSDISTKAIEVAKEIRNTEPITSPTPIARKSAVFEPGTVSNVLLNQMFGKVLVDGESVSFQQSPPCIVISSFLASFPYDACHTCRSGDEAWLSYWDAEQIYRVDQTGSILEKIECRVNVNSIAISPKTGRVWFSVKEDKSIREVMSDSTVVTRFNVKYVPRTLGITLGSWLWWGWGMRE
ncbi:uncharacterized protein [Argopecten irradians]|uniref:uncharacterized protein n=1 Tax=Argopecten irradians TaxID=31199 RepID=UPI00370F96A3